MPDTRTTSSDAGNMGNKPPDWKDLYEMVIAQVVAIAMSWRRLYWAAKDAERLIACLYELNLASALPLEGAWGRLAEAIETAERVIKNVQSVLDQATFAIHERNGQRGI